MREKRVVITGIGPLSSIGAGKNETWKNILDQEINVSLLDSYVFGNYPEKFHIHKINQFDIADFGLNSVVLEDIKKWQYGEEVIDLYYLMAAIKMALDDSRLQYEDRKDIGFVLTHENPGIEQFCSTFIKKSFDIYQNKKNLSKKEYFNSLNYSLDTNVNDLQTFIYLFHIAKLFNIHGYSLFINNSCASGSYAIETASQMIKSRTNNVVIVASSEHPAIYKHLWFKKLGILSEDSKTKPFSVNRSGFICGEGGTALVLEELEYALKRGAHIYAEYLGGSFHLESWKITIPHTVKKSYGKTINQALQKCNVSPQDIDIITTHGLGAPLVDQYEANAMTGVFGDYFARPFITAFKPFFGHTLGNCALLETVILLLSMQENTILPVLNFEGEDAKLKLKTVQEKIETELISGMKIVWGFGGYNAVTIFKKMDTYNAKRTI